MSAGEFLTWALGFFLIAVGAAIIVGLIVGRRFFRATRVLKTAFTPESVAGLRRQMEADDA